MAVAIFTASRSLDRSKPPFGGRIDWSHPLTYGLAEAVVLDEGAGNPVSLIYRDPATPVSSPTWAITRYGMSRSYSSGALDRFAHRPTQSITSAVSLAVGFVNNETFGTDAWHELAARRASTGNSAVEYALNFNTNSGPGRGIQFFWNTGSAYQIVNVSATNHMNGTGVFGVLIGTRATNNVGKIYSEGWLLTTSGALSSAGAGTTPFTLGACNDGSEPLNGTIYFAYVWNREISAAEAFAVTREPYSILVTRKRRGFISTSASVKSRRTLGTRVGTREMVA